MYCNFVAENRNVYEIQFNKLASNGEVYQFSIIKSYFCNNNENRFTIGSICFLISIFQAKECIAVHKNCTVQKHKVKKK